MTILEVADVPPSPNVIKRKYRNPHAYRKLRSMWEWALFTWPSPLHRNVLVHQAKTVGKLRVQITMHHAREYDPDNLVGAQKIILDSLVNVHFLAGDSSDKIELMPVVQFKCPHKDRKTVVKIWALE